HCLKLGPAPTARVGAIEHGAAEGTAIHRSRLEIEQQILQLAARVLQGSAVAAAAGVPDRLDEVDDLRAILAAGFVQLRARLREQRIESGIRGRALPGGPRLLRVVEQ